MHKTIQILPMITLSTLLIACSGGGKSHHFHEIQRTSSTESYVDEQGRKIVKKQQTVVEKHKESSVTAEITSLTNTTAANSKPAPLGSQAVPSKMKNANSEKPASRGAETAHTNVISVLQLIVNDKWKFQTDKHFKEKKRVTIALQPGQNRDEQHNYNIYMLDENAYYGYYQDSIDMNTVQNNFVYSFNELAENKGDLHQLAANYNGKFIYTTASTPQIATSSEVELKFQKGSVEGKVISSVDRRTLFEIKENRNNLRDLEFIPKTERLDNSNDQLVIGNHSPDRMVMSIKMINGADGTPNKYLVGKNGTDKYWGVLGAEKQ